MKRKFLAVAAAAICSLFAAGCLEYEEVIDLNKDGSGTFSVKFKLDMSEVEKVLGPGAAGPGGPDGEGGPGEDKGPTKEEIEEQFGNAEGITLKKAEVTKLKAGVQVHVVFDFVSLAALDNIEGFKDERTIKVTKRDDGNFDFHYRYDKKKAGDGVGLGGEGPPGGMPGMPGAGPGGGETIPEPPPDEGMGGTQPPPPEGGGEGGGEGENPMKEFEELAKKMEELMKKMSEQIKFVIKVNLPNEVTAVDESGKKDGKTATWDFSPKNNPDNNVMKADQNELEMKATFGGAGVTIK